MEVAPEGSHSRGGTGSGVYPEAVRTFPLGNRLLHLPHICRVEAFRSLHDIEFNFFAL